MLNQTRRTPLDPKDKPNLPRINQRLTNTNHPRRSIRTCLSKAKSDYHLRTNPVFSPFLIRHNNYLQTGSHHQVRPTNHMRTNYSRECDYRTWQTNPQSVNNTCNLPDIHLKLCNPRDTQIRHHNKLNPKCNNQADSIKTPR